MASRWLLLRWWNRAVLAVVYIAFAVVAVDRFRPAWLCALVGHSPNPWRCLEGFHEDHEESTCRSCGAVLRRPTPPPPVRAFAA